MAKFKLELQLENKSWMTLTDYETGTPSRNISFEEHLEENENDAYTLTFSVPEYLESGIRMGSLISIGRVLRLTFSHPERVVWFVVNNFQIGEGTENFIYSVSAQDYVSYVFSRNNAGLNLDTIEDQDFWEWMEEKNPAPNLIMPDLNGAKLGQDGVYTFHETSDEVGFLKYDSKTGQYSVKSSSSEGFEVTLMPNSFFDKGWYTFSVKSISGTSSSFPVSIIWEGAGPSVTLNIPSANQQQDIETTEITENESRLIKISVAAGGFEKDFTLQLEKGQVNNPEHVFAGTSNFRPTTVTNIGNYILERGWLKRKEPVEKIDWKVECNDKTFYDKKSDSDKYYQYNISVSDSNSYNALVELANISDTFMRIDYKERIIKFIHRNNHDKILDQNYTLKEGFNLLQSDVAYDGENLYGMFYINGGTDENDKFVTLSDEVRQKDNFLFDFSYFQEKGIISEKDLEDINLLIYGGTYDEDDGWVDENVSGITKNGEQISTKSLYSINSELQDLIAQKYELEGKINSFNTEIIIAAEALMPEGNLASDFPEKYKLLRDKFTTPSGDTNSKKVELDTKIYSVLPSQVAGYNNSEEYKDVELISPLTFISPWSPVNYPLQTNWDEWIEWGPIYPDNKWYRFKFSLTGEPDPGDSWTHYEKISDNIGGLDFWFIWAEGLNYIPIEYPYEADITLFSLRAKKIVTVDSLVNMFSYYRSMFRYDGVRRIREEKQKYIDKIEYFKAEWIKDAILLKNLESENPETEDTTILAEIKGLKDNIDDYRVGIGDYEFDPTTNTLTPNFNNPDKEGFGQKGFYQIILDMFNKYEIEFYESLSEDDKTIKPVMESYRDLMKLKKTFWFNMKENYGRNIFSEGYYDNEIEVNSLDLRAQAELIYRQHKKPNEDFSITYVDMSDVLGVDLQEIKVGDYIKINKTNIKLQTLDNTFLQVSAISRTLRSDADISLTITKYNMINSIIEKIVAGSNKR